MLCSILVHVLGDRGGQDCPKEHTLCVGRVIELVSQLRVQGTSWVYTHV